MIRLNGNKVAATPIFDPDKIGRIYVPDMAKERCDQGVVKYVGPKCEWIKPNDYILFSGYTGTLIKLEGEGLLIVMPEDFISCIIEAPNTDIPGLYFRGKNGEYFTATYEQAVELLARGIENSEWHKDFNVKRSEKPKPHEVTWR
jgi:co-chaperonin GroES (HSP10)